MTKQKQQPDTITAGGITYYQIKAFEFPIILAECPLCARYVTIDTGPLCWFCDMEQADQLQLDFERPKGITLGELINQVMQDWVTNGKLPLRMGS